ncbi:MAG: hypothetical protein CM1200mP36_08360 [Gammaproteobacteria bacterium]|nr:MAG: hypothetical protein CM1200mP36_08360 [Gammaproteobacteria bacterium]
MKKQLHDPRHEHPCRETEPRILKARGNQTRKTDQNEIQKDRGESGDGELLYALRMAPASAVSEIKKDTEK